MPRYVHIETSRGWKERFEIVEYFSETSSIFLWPCSLLLSAYLTANPDLITHSSVIELGSGIMINPTLCMVNISTLTLYCDIL